MPVTHTDYKLSNVRASGNQVTVRVRFYTGEYVDVDPGDGGAPVSTYQRTGGPPQERVYTFAAADYTPSRVRGYLNDQLDKLNALTNVSPQARRTAPTISPTREVRQ